MLKIVKEIFKKNLGISKGFRNEKNIYCERTNTPKAVEFPGVFKLEKNTFIRCKKRG